VGINSERETATGLDMWVVCDRPTDFPRSFVAKKFVVSAEEVRATSTMIVGESIAVIREILFSRGMVSLGRCVGDDPNIVEVWV